MARPLTRAQALENRAFIKTLRRTGNVRLACRELGLKYGTMQHRRRKHPAFALRWDAALAFAQAGFEELGRRGPKAGKVSRHASESHDVGRARSLGGLSIQTNRTSSETRRPVLNSSSTEAHLCSAKPPFRSVFRTEGGEMVVCRRNDGKLQMRRAQPGKLTREAEQAFLAAVSATCNLSLAAAAVGSCFNAFNRRRRKDPAFARELRLALQRGYEALEMALLESLEPASHEHGDWRNNDPPAMPPMSANQALQLMYLHQKAALLVDEPTPMRRRRGESHAACCERLAQMSEAREQRAREAFEVAEAERYERGEQAWGPAGEEVRSRMGLPDLAQVTGWSRADPAKELHGDSALFGGWRIEDMQQELERREWEWAEAEEEERGGRLRG
jgi:hypothetical protein